MDAIPAIFEARNVPLLLCHERFNEAGLPNFLKSLNLSCIVKNYSKIQIFLSINNNKQQQQQ
jgi:hypothetical protein